MMRLALIATALAVAPWTCSDRPARASATDAHGDALRFAEQRQGCPDLVFPDRVPSPDGTVSALVVPDSDYSKRIRIVREGDQTPMGEFAADLTNLLWRPDGSGIVFAVSPIYDRPGIFLYDLSSRTVTRLVAPKNFSGNPGYKDGADWFMLCSIDETERGTVAHYLRFDDVDALDFKHLSLQAPQDSIMIPRR